MEDDEAKPWNLRSRNGAVRVCSLGIVRRRNAYPPAPEIPMFSVSLTEEEIAEDIYAVTGSLPPRRPKRRARAVQRQLDLLFPGGWLSEMAVESHKVSSLTRRYADRW